MNFYISLPQGAIFDRHFPPHVLDRLARLGNLSRNLTGKYITAPELLDELTAHETDILITHWGTPQVTGAMLDALPRLKMLAHPAGTVAHIASPAFFERDIPVLSANPIMARFVAEAVLGDMIAGLRHITVEDDSVRSGGWRANAGAGTLFGAHIGLIGLGTVGRNLLTLLAPFGCQVSVYDPYLPQDALAPWPFAAQCDMDTALAQPIVSLHAAQTPETFHLIDARALTKIPHGGLLINTARGSLIDTDALVTRLSAGELTAVLDVYEQEGRGKIPQALQNVPKQYLILSPHTAALPATYQMTEAIIDDIERFLRGDPLTLRVSRRTYDLMTQE